MTPTAFERAQQGKVLHPARAPFRPDDNVVYAPSFFRDSERLLIALRHGQPGARAALFARHADQVELLLRRILGPDDEVPSLLLRVFARASLALRRRRSPDDVELWLERLAVRQAKRTLVWRRFARRLSFGRLGQSAFSASMDAAVEGRKSMPVVCQTEPEELRQVYALVHSLPAAQATILCLYWAAGCEVAQVAELCGLSLSRTARLLDTGRRTLLRRARRAMVAGRGA